MNRKFLLVISGLFLAVAAGMFALHQAVPAYHLPALLGGDVLMAILCILAYMLVNKQMRSRPQAFVRGVSAATFLKLLVCMAAFLIYALVERATIHKPTLYVLFGIYIVFTIAETWMLSSMAKEK